MESRQKSSVRLWGPTRTEPVNLISPNQLRQQQPFAVTLVDMQMELNYVSTLNSYMFELSRSPPLSRQKQRLQLKRGGKRIKKIIKPAAERPGEEQDLCDLSVLEVAQCANKPRHISSPFSLLLLLNPSNYEKTLCTNISERLCELSCSGLLRDMKQIRNKR